MELDDGESTTVPLSKVRSPLPQELPRVLDIKIKAVQGPGKACASVCGIHRNLSAVHWSCQYCMKAPDTRSALNAGHCGLFSTRILSRAREGKGRVSL